MADRRLLEQAIAELAGNPEQTRAVHITDHCVVRAGPGSGKTKTLVVAMARALAHDILAPRGIACITFNNECAQELEERFEKLGNDRSDNVFIGTVHSFAMAQIIAPYAKCVAFELPPQFRVATNAESAQARCDAYERLPKALKNSYSMKDLWRQAERKRRKQVDRSLSEWRDVRPELADFVESYEAELRQAGLIDFDDMPLIAYRMLRDNPWIGKALWAKFPVLFVDEYQDLGFALHELVTKLCFESGIRLFAVGDPDQSIYSFTGANPQLFQNLASRKDVTNVSLRLNYRCGTSIIEVSEAALGENRAYSTPDDAITGNVTFVSVNGDIRAQATHIAKELIPSISAQGVSAEQICVLYRTADEGGIVESALTIGQMPTVRADKDALVSRSSRICRLIESCARWVAGGWLKSNPRFDRLVVEAISLIYGPHASFDARRKVEQELGSFLISSLGTTQTVHAWLVDFHSTLIIPWEGRSQTSSTDWGTASEMVAKTKPGSAMSNMPLAYLGGSFEGSGSINLSTYHSAKGREFDAVILFAVNSGLMPNRFDAMDQLALSEARRLFYVGVTRARRLLYLVFSSSYQSPWIDEMRARLTGD